MLQQLCYHTYVVYVCVCSKCQQHNNKSCHKCTNIKNNSTQTHTHTHARPQQDMNSCHIHLKAHTLAHRFPFIYICQQRRDSRNNNNNQCIRWKRNIYVEITEWAIGKLSQCKMAQWLKVCHLYLYILQINTIFLIQLLINTKLLTEVYSIQRKLWQQVIFVTV